MVDDVPMYAFDGVLSSCGVSLNPGNGMEGERFVFAGGRGGEGGSERPGTESCSAGVG